MIDDPKRTDVLMSMLTESLPIEANVTPYLAGELREKSPGMSARSPTLVTPS
jgi:hypothetical protein